jgi:hypothetical protein
LYVLRASIIHYSLVLSISIGIPRPYLPLPLLPIIVQLTTKINCMKNLEKTDFAIASLIKGMFKDAIKEVLPEMLSEYLPKKDDSAEFLGAQQSADFIGESLSSFYQRTSKREIPFYKRGKKVFCKRSELIAWLESGKKATRKEMRNNW